MRVKGLNARLEEDVSVSDLATYLLNALHTHGNSTAVVRAAQHAANIRSMEDDEEQDEAAAGSGRERQRRGGRR